MNAGDFEDLINAYRADNSDLSSPIWIWFDKNEHDATCKICRSKIPRKNSSTGGATQHLKRHHNFLSKYNAVKVFDELSALKDQRVKNKKRKLDPFGCASP